MRVSRSGPRPSRAAGPALLSVLVWGVVVLAGTAGCVPPASAAGTRAAGRTVLVELFTSQGCSSCPAADAFVVQLPGLGLDRSRVVPLTYHIDYWNELGWTDPFAAPAFTDRQRRYAGAGGLSAPEGETGIHGSYTPQMIVDGTVHFSGARRDVALAEIARAAAAPSMAELTAQARILPDRAVVTVEARAGQAPPPLGQAWDVRVALAARSARTHVTSGENGGQTLQEAAIVRALSEPVRVPLTASAPVAAPITITVVKPRDLAWRDVELVALLQSESTLHVAAARSIPIVP